MKIVGVTMVRDEADIIGRTLTHMLAEGMDALLVADNLSTDGTSEILAELSRTAPIAVVLDEQPGYYQDVKMTALAEHAARDMGADWIVPFDADEFWSSRESGRLRDVIESTKADVLVADTLFHPPGCPEGMRPATAAADTKVCFRWRDGAFIAMGNHDVRLDGAPRRERGRVLIHEYQYRSFEQFKRKVRNGAAAFAATDLPENLGIHWRLLGAMSDEQLEREWKRMREEASVELVPDHWRPSGRELEPAQ